MLRMWRLKVREMEMELLTLWADTVDHFTKVKKMEIDMKYIDPTYMIRALPSNASDNISCTLLAQSAVHGAMAGYTGFTVGPANSRRAYIPIARGTEAQNTVKLTEDVGQTACFYKSA